MDKLVEQKIKEFALTYVGNHIQNQHPYALAARDGVITFDDLFFLGAVDAVQSETLQALVEMGSAPTHTERTEQRMVPFVVQDDRDFRNKISTIGYGLLAEMYKCTPQVAEDRFYDVQRKVTESHNQEIRKKAH